MAQIGPYSLEDILGRGALATVYRAVKDGRQAAVKVIRKDVLGRSDHEDLMLRFRREAVLCQEFDHPNIVRVYDAGETPDLAWLAMELVDGRELKSVASNRLPLEVRVGLMLQLLAALQAIHQRGVVHRDVKPANAMVTADYRLKLTDFGIARIPASELTLTGAILGTPSYMAPEQVLGRAIDTRADIYAAGATFYYLLTERKPFAGSLAEILQDVLHRSPPPPSSQSAHAPEEFDAVVAKAMSKAPEDRYADAAEFAAAVEAALQAALRRQADKSDDGTVICDAGTVVMASGDRVAEEDPQHLLLRMQRALAEVPATPLTAERLDKLRSDGERLLGLTTLAGTLRSGIAGAAASLPGLIRLHAPLPGTHAAIPRRGDWLELVELLALLHQWLGQLGAPDQTTAMVHQVADELSVAVMRYVAEVHGMVLSPDYVEVQRVTANLLRIDILEWGLELLSAGRLAREMRVSKRMIACEVMRKVSASIRDLITSADELARFDVANMLMEIEELIALAARVVEDDPDGGYGTYAGTMGRDVLGDFVVSSRGLVSFSRDELLQQCVAGSAGVTVFAANLRQLGRLYRFSMRLEEPGCREALKSLTAEVQSVIQDVAATLERALAERGSQQWLHQNLTALYEVAEELGLQQIARSLLARVRDAAAG